MTRLFGFLSRAWHSRDWHGLLLLLVICTIAGWLIAMPFSQAIQMSTIHRFHLTSRSFFVWSLQQPIPPMYNLENQYWFSPRPLTPDERTRFPPSEVETNFINHFAARMAALSPKRREFQERGLESWFYLQSKYGRSQHVTNYKVTPYPDSNMSRMEVVAVNARPGE